MRFGLFRFLLPVSNGSTLVLLHLLLGIRFLINTHCVPCVHTKNEMFDVEHSPFSYNVCKISETVFGMCTSVDYIERNQRWLKMERKSNEAMTTKAATAATASIAEQAPIRTKNPVSTNDGNEREYLIKKFSINYSNSSNEKFQRYLHKFWLRVIFFSLVANLYWQILSKFNFVSILIM